MSAFGAKRLAATVRHWSEPEAKTDVAPASPQADIDQSPYQTSATRLAAVTSPSVT